MTTARQRRGAAIIEMALLAFPLMILLFGMSVVGLNLGRHLHVAQICRDAGSMYVRGVDFSQDSNKDILVRLAYPLGLERTSGNGVVILSKITFIPQATCTALALNPCNGDKHVIMQRLVIGNASLKQSEIGTPYAPLLDAKGLVTNFMSEPSAVAHVPFISLSADEYAYVSETYFPSPDFDLLGFQTGSGNYARALF